MLRVVLLALLASLVGVVAIVQQWMVVLFVASAGAVSLVLARRRGSQVLPAPYLRWLVAGLAVVSPVVIAPGLPPWASLVLFWLFTAGAAVALVASRAEKPSRNVGLLAPLLGPAVLAMALVPDREHLAVPGVGGLALALAASRMTVSMDKRVRVVVLAMLVYLTANLVHWLTTAPWAAEALPGRGAGWESALAGTLSFPLSNNWADTAFLAAALGAVAVVLLRYSRGAARLSWLAVLALCLGVIGLNNGRFPLVVLVAVSLVFLLVPRLVVALSPLIPVGALLMPFWWPWVTSRMTEAFGVLARAAPWLDENGSTRRLQIELPSLNGRTIYWSGSSETLLAAEPDRVILGWGWLSGRESGAADRYEVLREAYLDELLPSRDFVASLAEPSPLPSPEFFIHHSAHSVLLQTWLDIGLLGVVYVALLLVAVTMLVRRHALDSPSPTPLALMAATLVLVLSAGVEQMLVPLAFHRSWWIFLMIAAVAAQPRSRGGSRIPT